MRLYVISIMETHTPWQKMDGQGVQTPEIDQTINLYVGARLRLRRKILGYSQARLGNEIGLTFQQIQKYEKGTSSIRTTRLWSLAEALTVPVSYFFDGMKDLKFSVKPADQPISADEMLLCLSIRNLTTDQRNSLHNLVAAFTVIRQ